jgi:hypothetical protein
MTNYTYDSIIQTGTAQVGGTNTITLATGASSTDDYYNGCSITITSGIGQGQVKLIIDYTGSTKLATVDSNWSTQPNNTSQYQVKQYPAWANGRDVVSAERLHHIENDGCKAAHDEFNTHKIGGDHDSRYYTQSQGDARYPILSGSKIPNDYLNTGSGNDLNADKWDGKDMPTNAYGRLMNDGNGNLSWGSTVGAISTVYVPPNNGSTSVYQAATDLFIFFWPNSGSGPTDFEIIVYTDGNSNPNTSYTTWSMVIKKGNYYRMQCSNHMYSGTMGVIPLS